MASILWSPCWWCSICWKILGCCGIKNMLGKHCSDIYIYKSESICVNDVYLKQGNHLSNISGVLKICLISGMVVCGSLCHPHQRVGLLISYCLAFFCCVHSNLLCHVWCPSLSLAIDIMCIPASPGFWKILPMILG